MGSRALAIPIRCGFLRLAQALGIANQILCNTLDIGANAPRPEVNALGLESRLRAVPAAIPQLNAFFLGCFRTSGARRLLRTPHFLARICHCGPCVAGGGFVAGGQ
jgi:hypothetical protein